MKNLALICFIALPAFAGERLLGSIVSAAGADTTNATTSTPFAVTPNTKLTVWCTVATSICMNSSTTCTLAGTTTNPGTEAAARTFFPTSADTGDLVTTAGAAVGPPRTVVVASKKSITIRIVASAASTCNVYARNGDE